MAPSPSVGVPRAIFPQLSAMLLFAFAASHSIKPEAGANIATSAACYVRLLRRVSKNTACWPEGDRRRGGHFGCTDNSTIYTTGHCAGLFACGNGQTVMCKDATCKCEMPCHRQPYMQNELLSKGLHCPPAMPSIPYPPPLPPMPPLPPPPSPPPAGDGRVAACEKSCQLHPPELRGADSSEVRLAAAESCKCAACSFDGLTPRLTLGAPCTQARHSGHHQQQHESDSQ